MDHQNIKFLDSAVPGFSLEAAAEIARDNAGYLIAALGRAVEDAVQPNFWWRGLTTRSTMANRQPMAAAAIQGSP